MSKHPFKGALDQRNGVYLEEDTDYECRSLKDKINVTSFENDVYPLDALRSKRGIDLSDVLQSAIQNATQTLAASIIDDVANRTKDAHKKGIGDLVIKVDRDEDEDAKGVDMTAVANANGEGVG